MQGTPVTSEVSARERYRLRLKRRRLLWRALRSRHQLLPSCDRTHSIAAGDILAFCVLRNEARRLPYFLEHYRRLGVDHFLFVDNGSDDGSSEILADQPDVSLWHTEASYRAARFGVNWLTWLQMRYAHNHWTLAVDVDEILIYPHHDSRDLKSLVARLDAQDQPALGALMLDMYPRGRLGDAVSHAGDDPFQSLCWFDNGPWRIRRQFPAENLWIQGGGRERVFFAETPQRSPTLNKLPLVRWNRRFAYLNSTHSILPPRLNRCYAGPGGAQLSGVLMHSKFLNDATTRARQEKHRREHFHHPEMFDDYYDRLAGDPVLWWAQSVKYEGWQQLEHLGLMARGGWD